MKFLEKHTVFIAGKRICLLSSDDAFLLHQDILFLQDLYMQISNEYNNKLDRESVFLFIIFKILNEKHLVLDKLQHSVNLIDSFQKDIAFVKD